MFILKVGNIDEHAIMTVLDDMHDESALLGRDLGDGI